MPEMIRSFAARLREFIGNRRRAPRYSVRLPVSLSVVDARGVNGSRRPPTISAYTCDLSSTGIGLMVSAIRMGDQYLTGEARVLRIALELLSGTVQIKALPVRHEQMQGEEKVGFLIGVRILELSAEDRNRYTAHLKETSVQKPT